MDAKERLRAYLEQRRELGESEFLLDGLSVEEAMRALGAIGTGGAIPPRSRAVPAPPATPPAREAPAPEPEARPVAEAEPEPEVEPAPAPDVREESPREVTVDMKAFTQGLVVGQANGSLFEDNPFSGVRSLKALAEIIEKCTRCPLYKTATHAVPGDGSAKAEMMVVGEAPGANEDETGHPFVGQAGQLLTKILAAIDLTREDVFIANVLKHRPPGNRDPKPNEVEACSPYLARQIQLVKPKVILALGTFAAQTLLDTKTPIGKLRGAVHRYHGVPLVVTYHPAALLRNPAWKRPTWEDVKLARRVLDSAK
jgi:DNA polymerase